MWQGLKNIYHFFVAVLCNVLFLFPARKITVVGVTGTDGKTTTVKLIYEMLRGSGEKVSAVSSIGALINGKDYPLDAHVTTPSSFTAQKFLRRAVSQKSKYFVIELTSHAIDQYRPWGIHFKIGVLTNVTSEHLDYHKTYDNYLKTKAKLLLQAEVAIVNADDSSYTQLVDVRNRKASDKWITYGFTEASDINLINFPINAPYLMGDFNKYNALAALACAKTLGVKDQSIRKTLLKFKPPLGRTDIVYKNSFSVMVDFAHTPNSFSNVLSSIKPHVKGRLIHVFGSAGERDISKRPFMGEISSKYSNIVILTSEDPRSEDPEAIVDQIASGIKEKDCQVFRIIDRQQAIDAALQMAKKDDLVLVTGKAHEKTMNYGEGEVPWSEYKAVAKALSKRYESTKK